MSRSLLLAVVVQAFGCGISGLQPYEPAAPQPPASSNQPRKRDTQGEVLGDATGVLAVPAAKFLESLGACVHVAQGVDDPLRSADALAYAGIRNFRDDGSEKAVPSWIAMHARTGVRACMLPNRDLATTIQMAKRLRAEDALLAVEGPNEPNNFPVTYQGAKSSYETTFLPVAHFQRDLYAAIKGEPTLASVPVFHSSEAGGAEPDNVGLQYLTIPDGVDTLLPAQTRYADFANVHNYVCGHRNELADNAAWNAADPTLKGDWDSLFVEYGVTWHKKFKGYTDTQLLTLPRVSTETGWPTSGTPGAITEAQQASLYLDVYLSSFKRGFSYTFLYMLRDDPKQGYWGLFDTAYEPKASAKALHNFTSVLADVGVRPPGKLAYTLETTSPTVHDLLLQKSDGTFVLVLWGERFTGVADRVTVKLGSVQTKVRGYDPKVDKAPVQEWRNVRALTAELSDHPFVLQFLR